MEKIFVILGGFCKHEYIIMDTQTKDACVCTLGTVNDLLDRGHCVYGVRFERDRTGKVVKRIIEPCNTLKLPRNWRLNVDYNKRDVKAIENGIRVSKLRSESTAKDDILCNFLYINTSHAMFINSKKPNSNTLRGQINYSSDGVTFIIELLYLPPNLRGTGLGEKLINSIILFARLTGHKIVELAPFPSDIVDNEFQNYSKINKLVRYYKKFGFKLVDESSFKGFFSYETSGRINYNHKCLYDDLCGCNTMVLYL